MPREAVNMGVVEKQLMYMRNNVALGYTAKNVYADCRYDFRGEFGIAANVALGENGKLGNTWFPEGVQYNDYFKGIGLVTDKQSVVFDKIITNKSTYKETDIANEFFTDRTIRKDLMQLTTQTSDQFIMKVLSERLYAEMSAETKACMTAAQSDPATFYKLIIDEIAALMYETNVVDPTEFKLLLTPKKALLYNAGRQLTNLNAALRAGSEEVAMAAASVPFSIIAEDNFKTAYTFQEIEITRKDGIVVTAIVYRPTATALQMEYAIFLKKATPWDIAESYSGFTDRQKVGDGMGMDINMYERLGGCVQVKLNKFAKIKTAYVPVTGVVINEVAATIADGTTKQLTATVSPATASVKSVLWTSSDAEVATVDANGLVTAVPAAVGPATITATTVDGAKRATVVITVE